MPKSRKSPLVIHPDRLTGKPLAFAGTVSPGDLPRLAETLATPEGELNYTVEAGLDPQRRKVVSCIIEGFVFLTCQVTLDTFRHPVSIDDRLVLVDDESRLPPIEEESDREDYLVADAPLSVLELVEDAVMLALPMVPRKPGLDRGEAARAPETPSPFARLASLKRDK
jgi:uncharacterized protein